MKNIVYELRFDRSSIIQVKDGALTFTVNKRATSRYYVPLEYHRDDVITMCRQIQAIYARRVPEIQFMWYKPDILSIQLDQFPVIFINHHWILLSSNAISIIMIQLWIITS